MGLELGMVFVIKMGLKHLHISYLYVCLFHLRLLTNLASSNMGKHDDFEDLNTPK